jgi:hypothetical protein
MLYVKANGTIRVGGLVALTPAWEVGFTQFLATEVPNTANLGRPLYVAMTSMTTGQFGWCIASGTCLCQQHGLLLQQMLQLVSLLQDRAVQLLRANRLTMLAVLLQRLRRRSRRQGLQMQEV